MSSKISGIYVTNAVICKLLNSKQLTVGDWQLAVGSWQKPKNLTADDGDEADLHGSDRESDVGPTAGLAGLNDLCVGRIFSASPPSTVTANLTCLVGGNANFTEARFLGQFPGLPTNHQE